ncbi:hypothetical protein MPER_02853, partial [Moniliophthora perniciosa FA553]
RLQAPPQPLPNTINVEFILSVVNPVDINTIQGIYPVKPSPEINPEGGHLFIGGKEGLAKVDQVGEGVHGLEKGDWVVMHGHQVGTWAQKRNILASDVVKLTHKAEDGLSEVNAATITINPPTVYNLLNNFVQLHEGDWILQNGANSAIAKARKVNSINFMRE